MTFAQRLIIAVIWVGLMVAGISLFGESHPVSLEGRSLQIEMNAYIDKFTDEVGMTDASIQWAVMVLPVLEMDSPAVTYGWLLPPEHRFFPGEPEIWIGLFTFHKGMMLMMDPRMRRVVAGHEVAHMMSRCMIDEPDLTGLDDMAAMLLEFNYAVILESCADIVSAELTSAKDVLDTLHFLKATWASDNIVLVRRIQVMARVLQREAHNE